MLANDSTESKKRDAFFLVTFYGLETRVEGSDRIGADRLTTLREQLIDPRVRIDRLSPRSRSPNDPS